MLGADRRHLLDKVLHVAPVGGHGLGVVNDEHGVKAPQPREASLVDSFRGGHLGMMSLVRFGKLWCVWWPDLVFARDEGSFVV